MKLVVSSRLNRLSLPSNTHTVRTQKRPFALPGKIRYFCVIFLGYIPTSFTVCENFGASIDPSWKGGNSIFWEMWSTKSLPNQTYESERRPIFFKQIYFIQENFLNFSRFSDWKKRIYANIDLFYRKIMRYFYIPCLPNIWKRRTNAK